ncbi:hypothetical protein [Streptomyces sp. 2A115]|uniref:hypothetical protein n=1 Tax=Streptomyces sp. 2A115 TaxID=3457439 RepID=UPI003FD1287E
MADYEGSSAADALLAAITDEPLPEGAHDNAEFMAEHRSAVADVALLREQLRAMGDTLATASERSERSVQQEHREQSEGPERSAEPVPLRPPTPFRPPKPHWSLRFAGVALGAMVAAVGTAMLGGLVWLGANGGSGDTGASSDSNASAADEGSGKLAASPEMHIACSKVLVEGTVRSITPTGDGNVRVALDVKRYYRPERSATDHPTITVTLLDSAREDLKVGTYTLIRVPVYPEDRQDWETGWGVGDAREGIVDALPGARGLKCAGPPQGRG